MKNYFYVFLEISVSKTLVRKFVWDGKLSVNWVFTPVASSPSKGSNRWGSSTKVEQRSQGNVLAASEPEGLQEGGNSVLCSRGVCGLRQFSKIFSGSFRSCDGKAFFPTETSAKCLRHSSNFTKSEIYWPLKNPACVQHVIIQTTLSQGTTYLMGVCLCKGLP